MPKCHIRSIHIYSSSFSTAALRGIVRTPVMHQHTTGYIVGVIVRNLEIVDLDRALQQLMLNLFYDDILTVDQNENIARTHL